MRLSTFLESGCKWNLLKKNNILQKIAVPEKSKWWRKTIFLDKMFIRSENVAFYRRRSGQLEPQVSDFLASWSELKVRVNILSQCFSLSLCLWNLSTGIMDRISNIIQFSGDFHRFENEFFVVFRQHQITFKWLLTAFN